MTLVENKVVKFIFALYERQAKMRDSFKKKLSRITRRLRVINRSDVNETLRRATAIRDEIFLSFSFHNNNASPISREHVEGIKETLEDYILDACTITETGGPLIPFSLMRRTTTFFKEWNAKISLLDKQFLPFYGDVYCLDLAIHLDNFMCILKSMKTCRNIPGTLRAITDDSFQNAVKTCLQM